MFGKTSSRCHAAVKATRSRSELRLPSVSGAYKARGPSRLVAPENVQSKPVETNRPSTGKYITWPE